MIHPVELNQYIAEARVEAGAFGGIAAVQAPDAKRHCDGQCLGCRLGLAAQPGGSSR